MLVGMVTILVIGHALLGAIWLGAMTYSLVVVQPRARRFFGHDGLDDEEAHEAFVTTLAAGNRWTVLGLVAALAATGIATFVLAGDRAIDRLPFHVAKAVLLLAALVVFARVSWWIWPRRVFALPEERPALHADLRRSAYAMVGLVGTAFALGVAAASPG